MARGDSSRGSALTSRFRVSYRCALEPRQPWRAARRDGPAGWRWGEAGAGSSAPHLAAEALMRAADGVTCKGRLG